MTGRTEDMARDLFLERFKGNLIRARHAAGMSQAMLGVETDLHPTAISKLERGERIPRLDTAVRLTSALDVSVAQLVVGISWEAPPVRRAGRFSAEAGRSQRDQGR